MFARRLSFQKPKFGRDHLRTRLRTVKGLDPSRRSGAGDVKGMQDDVVRSVRSILTPKFIYSRQLEVPRKRVHKEGHAPEPHRGRMARGPVSGFDDLLLAVQN